QEGNRLQHALLQTNEIEDDAMLERLMAVFSKEFFTTHRATPSSSGDAGKTSIFIVGMPRSGTSLLEQILATYPGIFGAGELTDIGEVVTAAMPGGAAGQFPGAVPGLSAEDFKRMGEDYVKRVRQRAPDATRITDKLPANFLYLGMIHLMLPNARIIHAMRDPMDSCFSCYSRLFDTNKLPFAYDLESLGRYYDRYSKLMRHWHAVLPAGTILDVRYEDMVADTEGHARRLLVYLGLPWDDRCLAFHQNKRQVATASAAQVRKPIYKTSVARWEHFRTHLAPLLDLVKDYRDAPAEMKKIGLNDPCPCGSGKNYKQCCLPNELPMVPEQHLHASAAETLSPADIVQLASLYKSGRHVDMENKARALIEHHPNSGFAWKALGVCLRAQGKDAMHALQMAVQFLPGDADTVNNFGNALRDKGRLDDAVASYRRALEINPELVEARGNLGNALRDLGNLDEAAATLRKALELKPDFAKAHYNLGNTLRDLGQLDDAVTSYRRALEIEPDLIEAHCSLGNALRDLGQLDAAITCYRQALKIKPDYIDAYCNIGVALTEQGHLEEASLSFESAIAI
ncbi:MAG TPA: tetratricopeptide repeat protein, partial [Burkholderiaceae bacterium]|nr:tetratricopeptide repeat protein [Burkholderiaceae bacterium]